MKENMYHNLIWSGAGFLLSDIYLDYISYCEENRNKNIFTKQSRILEKGNFLLKKNIRKRI